MFLGTKRFDPSAEEQPKKRPKHDDQSVTEPVATSTENDEYQNDPKNKSILSKFQKSVQDSQPDNGDSNNDESSKIQPEIQEHDLVELPMPKQSKQTRKNLSKLAPNWMSEPEYVPIDTTKRFEDFAGILSKRMLSNLKAQGYDSAFAIQTAVLPQMLQEMAQISPDPLQDILVNAYTGSGKTLSYGIPIVEGLSKRVVPRIRALIILPTKPLIQQVFQVIESLAKGTSLRITMLRTDRAFKEEQKLLASSTPDILITTPGRLVDHIRQSAEFFTLQHLRYFVVDEADRLMNQSFQEWVDVVISALPKAPEQPGFDKSQFWFRPVQKLVFSATLTRDPGKLASLKINDPRIYVVGTETVDYEFSVPQQLVENLVPIKSLSVKPLELVKLLVHNGITSDTLIFVKSNEAAGRLARLISLVDENLFSGDLVVERCSGELELKQRKKMLRLFADGKIGILVCTDLIARGIDISSIKHVINYDLPIGKREYVHRVGRTARAGNSGTAWSLACSRGEHKHFWNLANAVYRPGEQQKVQVWGRKDGDNDDDDGEKDQDQEQDQEDERLNEGYQKALEQLEQEVFSTRNTAE